jgi:HAD superfamily hydrolase (TIGR01509 family)
LVPYIGRHLIDEFLDLGFSQADAEDMMREYREIYPQRKHANTKAYAGISEVLRGLGGRKTTATTKGTPTARSILEQFALLPHFDHVQGTDGFPAKPQPDVILKALEALGASAGECLFVGDSAADMEAGKRAGVRTCAVLWGYGSEEELTRWQPDFRIHSPFELLAGD